MALVRTTELFKDYREAMEAFIDERWSDGLPVMLPTPDLVDALIAAGGRAGAEVLGIVPTRELPIHVWQAATSAVMAGCKPSYFPVVLAGWDAMLAPEFNLYTVLSSTGGPAICCVVSGPYAQAIGINGFGVMVIEHPVWRRNDAWSEKVAAELADRLMPVLIKA